MMLINKTNNLMHFIQYLAYWLIVLMILFMLGGCWQDYVRPESEQGFYYVVQKGDTLYRIARENHIALSQLAEKNGLENPDVLKEGTVLFIPGTRPPGETYRQERLEKKTEDLKKVSGTGDAAAAKKGQTTVADTNNSDKNDETEEKQSQAKSVVNKTSDQKTGDAKAAKSSRNADEAKDKIALKQKEKTAKTPMDNLSKSSGDVGTKGEFIWPLKGKVISNYGRQPNGMFYNGIRIETNKESAVGAACGGHVIFSALLKDYGETIIIKHDNNYATVYTHLSKRLVRVDQRINKGDKIAVIVPGNTGAAYFDFEIRYKNKAKDPLLFL